MHPSLKIYDESITDFINTDFEMQTLADDCEFTEGPVWNTEGFYLFSDINANLIYKISAVGTKEPYISNSGTENLSTEGIKRDHAGSNGLAYDKENELLVCRHGAGEVAKWKEGKLQPFISSYEGRRFNSPNDVTADESGRIFFSDPPYGLKEGKLNPQIFQPRAAVYCWHEGVLKIVSDKYQYPNGVCISPGKKELYICSNKPFEKFISVYDAETLQYKKVLAEENSDGIKCDPAGNVYLCNNDGLIILDKEGRRLAVIKLATVPANICWGGSGLKDLFITARENIFLIKNLLR
ncbi:MAG TPA: SMP-30/gluconolactonase/LRE family protein [Flavisolibacter sp.]|nr:SMP-30/gluconolactonase/LRE family protein [Flavisolibacter sp.]